MKIHNKIAICLALTSFLLQSTYAHTYLSSVNGLAEFDTIRPERPTYERNSPIVDITSADMTCGWLPYASQPANRKLPIAAGASLTLQFWHDGPYADDFIIDSSHRGPCMIYMAADSSNPKWFKIWEMGLDSNNKFCVDYLRSNTGVNNAGKGKLTVQIPSWVPTGNYLLRTEIIALHEGYAIGKAQFYVNCVELSVTNSGFTAAAVSSIPTVSFPGTYSVTDPGIFYNLYGSYLPAYVIPGPSVYKPSMTSPTTPSPSPVTTAPVTTAPVTPSPSTPAPTPTVTYPPVTYPPTTAAPTTKPPTAPTTTPTTPTADAIHIQIHPSATIYWLAIRIAGPSVETIKVELKDSGSYSSYTAFANTNWGYFVFGQGQVTLPVSLRLTNVNGQVVELPNVITTLTSGATITTSTKYGGSAPTTSAPAPVTSAPTTSAPAPVTSAPVTSAPVTSAPVTNAPVTSAPVTAAPTAKANAPDTAGPTSTAPSVTKVQVHAGSSQWWFAVAIVDAAKTVASVQVKDSTSEAKYVNLAPSDWGYWVYQSATGQPLVAPLSIRITSTVGTSLVVNNVPVTVGVVYGDSQL